MSVVFFGAFDRYNYGDFLFPRILQAAFEEAGVPGPYHCAGQVFSNFTNLGGVVTEPLQTLKETLQAPLDIIHVGGEVLGCDNRSALAMNLPQPAAALFLHAFTGSAWENSLQQAFGTVLGYVDAPANASRRVFFNSIGGTSLPSLPESIKRRVGKTLASATYLSVRDTLTQKWLQEIFQLNPVCAPDCAVLLRKYFSKETELPVSRLDGETLPPGGYFAFQANHYLLAHYGKTICSELTALWKEFKLPIALVPIGTATFHDDDIALSAVHEELQANGVKSLLCRERHIFHTARILRHSRAVIASSLHARITALAFAVPRLTLGLTDQKHASCIRTWEPELLDISFSKNGEIVRYVKPLLEVPKSAYESISQNCEKEAGTSLARLTQMILKTKRNALEPSVYETRIQNFPLAVSRFTEPLPVTYDQLLEEKTVLEQRLLRKETELLLLRNTLSWRITAPLRKMRDLVRWIQSVLGRKRDRPLPSNS